jgi:hypothetical protein
MQFTRFLRNRAVTPQEMSAHTAAQAARRAAGRDVLAIQDTSELRLGDERWRDKGFSKIGRKTSVSYGLLLHPVLAVDAGTGEVIGLVDVTVWNRRYADTHRRSRPLEDKESQRWLDGTMRASEVLAQASRITVVADRESDFYEEFARRPANVELIIRAGQNRAVQAKPGDGGRTLLFAFANSLPQQHVVTLTIPAAPGRKQRTAQFAVRYAQVTLCKPLHALASDLPQTVSLNLLDIRETSQPGDGPPIHWRILTTYPITDLAQARRIVDLYRRRWTIEEYFRSLKTAGFEIEDAQIGDPAAMSNFTAACAIAAVTIMQLVRARDGAHQIIEDAFEDDDRPLLEAICPTLEGKTQRQKNPHPKGSLAYAAWVIARLGGWDGYYGKPGPLVMRRGLHDFHQIKYGANLPAIV